MRNWAGNYSYSAEQLHRPSSLDELREIVAAAPRIRVLGSRHSFNAIADSDALVSLTDLPADVVVDHAAATVTFSAGLTYGGLAAALEPEGVALANLASLPHISVAGAVATATHGSGVGNRNLAAAVAALELVTSSGEVVRAARGDDGFDGMVVGLGALGAVTRVDLDVEPAFDVAQRVYERMPWETVYEHLDEITAAGYSVSLFTLWREGADGGVEMVWVKSRTDDPGAPGDELFGAPAATGERHPIPGLDPQPATPQLGSPGLWSDRLPHFRMGFTPSNGDEIQSEYLVPRRSAVEALEAVRALAPRIRPLLQTCEIRTVAADGLWMSTSHDRASLAMHFTWLPAQEAVTALLAELERALAPFAARPHWGKLFLADAAAIAPLYPRHADFVRLAERLDPRGAFRNAWLERHVLGSA
jgi:alditol oxidase